jgi:hypothetical protein
MDATGTMLIRGEIVRAGGILLMMVRGVYRVVDDRWLTLGLATLANPRVISIRS